MCHTDLALPKLREGEVALNLLFFTSTSFNGTPVAVWDFIADPGLRWEIPLRNSPYSRYNTNLDNSIKSDYDPIVITLPKDPDWDELN